MKRWRHESMPLNARLTNCVREKFHQQHKRRLNVHSPTVIKTVLSFLCRSLALLMSSTIALSTLSNTLKQLSQQCTSLLPSLSRFAHLSYNSQLLRWCGEEGKFRAPSFELFLNAFINSCCVHCLSRPLKSGRVGTSSEYEINLYLVINR